LRPPAVIVARKSLVFNGRVLEGRFHYNENDEPTTAGILKWAKRPADKFPLPHLTWEIFYDSTAMKLIDGPDKKLKGGEHKQKSAN